MLLWKILWWHSTTMKTTLTSIMSGVYFIVDADMCDKSIILTDKAKVLVKYLPFSLSQSDRKLLYENIYKSLNTTSIYE